MTLWIPLFDRVLHGGGSIQKQIHNIKQSDHEANESAQGIRPDMTWSWGGG